MLLLASLALLLSTTVSAAQPRAQRDRFDERAAWAFLKRQVALGPRPAGSRASRRLAAILRASIPRGRYQAVPADSET
jgi:glutaminyl-peptide cyclotransferase